MIAQRFDELRLTGSGGANRVMLYPFEPQVAWVAACYHRTSSRITWDLCSSGAVRLEPLFADLVPLLPVGNAARIGAGSSSIDDTTISGNSFRFTLPHR